MAYEDLLKDTSESKDDGNYFLVTITDLDLGTAYPLQFRWKNKNGTLGAWSSVKTFVSESATIPSEPNLGSGDVVGGAGFIKVTWDGNNALSTAASNFDRVNVHISGSPFGDGTKPSGFFKQAGTQTFTAPAGVYIVQLKILTVNGSESLFSTARTVTVTSAAPAAESSVTPSTPTVSSVLGAIQLSWNGKTSSGGDQPFGFNAAKVYVGTSAGFTPSSSNQVDVLNFANGQNTLNIGVGTIVNSVALDYGIDYYIKIATTNGTDTSTPVSATGNPVRVGQVTSGDIVTVTADKIATGTLSSGSTITVGSTSGKHIKLSGTGDPFIIYGSGGVANPVLSYNGAKLTVVGDGTFTGDISGATGTLTNALNVGTISGGLYPFSVSSSGVIRAISGTIGGLTLAADAIQNTGNTFRLDSSGIIRAGSSTGSAIMINPTLGIYHSLNGGTSANGYFTLGLSSGTIAGWTLSSSPSQISKGSTILDASSTDGFFQIGSGSSFFKVSTSGIQLGNETFGSAPFRVTAAGALTAVGANLSGSLTVTSGTKTTSISSSTGLITITDTSSGILSGGGISISADGGSGLYTPTQVNFTRGTFTASSFIADEIAGVSLGTFLITSGANSSIVLKPNGGTASSTYPVQIDGLLRNPLYSISSGSYDAGADAEVAGSMMTSTGSVVARRDGNIPFFAHRYLSIGAISGNAEQIRFIMDGSDRGGVLSSSTGSPSFRSPSDYRLKENIRDFTNSIDVIKSKRVRVFNLKNDPNKAEVVGFVADEFGTPGDEFVIGEKDAVDADGNPEYQSIAITNLIPYLAGALKEAILKIEFLESRLDALEG